MFMLPVILVCGSKELDGDAQNADNDSQQSLWNGERIDIHVLADGHQQPRSGGTADDGGSTDDYRTDKLQCQCADCKSDQNRQEELNVAGKR